MTRTPEYFALIEALNLLAADMIRAGGDPVAVQAFVDAELDRIEKVGRSNDTRN